MTEGDVQVTQRGGGQPPVRRAALLLLLAATLLPATAAPVAAITVSGSVPMACPIITVADVAVLGADTVVFGRMAPSEPSETADYLLCRLGATGAAVWTRTVSGVLPTSPASLAVGSASIYVGYASLDPVGWRLANVRRFGLDGTQHETSTTPNGVHTEFGDIAAAPDGRVYLTGATGGQALVRSFEANLAIRWTDLFRGVVSTLANPAPAPGAAWGKAIAASASGIYVTGQVIGALPGGPTHRSREDAFVRAYTAAGAVSWTRQFGLVNPNGTGGNPTEMPAYAADVAVSSQGVHVVGQAAYLDDGVTDRRDDAFQRLYAVDGAIRWTARLGGGGDDGSLRIMPDAGGSVLFGFAGDGLASNGHLSSMFLARFGTAGSIDGSIEFNPDAWWLFGAGTASDGTVIRIASLVDRVLTPQPNDPRILPPGDRTIIRVDAIPPAVGAPIAHAVPRLAMSSTTMPINVAWSATDGASTVAASELQVSRDGGAYASLTVTSPATRSVRTWGRPGGTIRFRVRATDSAGNASAWIYGPTVTLSVVQETSTSIVETSSWGRVVRGGALGGYVDRTLVSGASAKYTFTGRGIAWLSTVGTTRGKANVYVDGVFVATIDTYAPTGASATIVFERAWTTSAKHTIEIRNKATSGRPRIDLDALIVFK